jgi:sodium/pantothenate symporter
MNVAILIFILYFVGIIAITLYSSRRLRKVSADNFSAEYFVGGRDLGPFSLAILVATGIASTGTFIGGPGVAARYGPGYSLLFVMGQILMNLIILGILGKKINIIGRRTNAQTFIDIFAARFENFKPLVLLLIGSIMIVLIALATAEFTGGSRVIQSMTGIPFAYSLIAFAVIIVAYSAFGGLKGVSLVGILQGILMTIASLILIVGYLVHFGGIAPIFEKVRMIDPALMTPGGGGPSGPAPLVEMLGYWLTYGLAYLGLPWAVQSTLGYKSTKTMKSAIVIGIVMAGIWTIFVGDLGGVAGRAFSPNLAVADFTIPVLVAGVLPPALVGIVLAGVAGAGQSTIAALFILASGSMVVSGHRLLNKKALSGRATKRLSVMTTVIIGVVTVLLALNPPSSLQTIITFAVGGSGSAFAPPLLLALFWPRANKYGAFTGVLVGMAAYIVFSRFSFGVELLHQLPVVFAALLSFLLTIIVSLSTRKPSKETLQTYFGTYEKEHQGVASATAPAPEI